MGINKYKWFLNILCFLCLICFTFLISNPFASAQTGVPSTVGVSSTIGVPSFSTLNLPSFGASTFGVSTFSTPAFGATSYNMPSYSMTNYGIGSYGTTNYGLSSYGMTSYGAGSYGMTGYGMTGYGMGGYGMGGYGMPMTGFGMGGYGMGGYGMPMTGFGMGGFGMPAYGMPMTGFGMGGFGMGGFGMPMTGFGMGGFGMPMTGFGMPIYGGYNPYGYQPTSGGSSSSQSYKQPDYESGFYTADEDPPSLKGHWSGKWEAFKTDKDGVVTDPNGQIKIAHEGELAFHITKQDSKGKITGTIEIMGWNIDEYQNWEGETETIALKGWLDKSNQWLYAHYFYFTGTELKSDYSNLISDFTWTFDNLNLNANESGIFGQFKVRGTVETNNGTEDYDLIGKFLVGKYIPD